MRLPGFGGWHEDPLWARFYDWTVENPRPGGVLWRVGVGSDLSLLHAAAGEIGRLPAGARVLDVPCGGGVAMRALRPGQGVDYVAADIAPAMLRRTASLARELGVADQVHPQLADVAALPFADAGFDLVLSLTGLHCFPDPRQAVREMRRVLAPGGVLSGSALLRDSGRRYEHVRLAGRAAGLLGPLCTGEEIRDWLRDEGLGDVMVRKSGAIGYFRAEAP
ncbi:class I SAM-dependent methyltransferase [Nocardioides pacificus]